MVGTGIASLTLALLFPVLASAATLSPVAVRTQQVLPNAPTTCAPLDVREVNPFIYDNELNSFDVTIDDASYVSITGAVGDTGIPLNFMSRRANLDGTVTIHIDLDGTPVRGTLPVSLTLLSAAKSQSVCAAVVSFALSGPSTPTYSSPTHPSAPSTPTAPTAPTKPTTPSTPTAPATTSGSGTGTGTTGPIVGSMIGGGFRESLTSACIAAGPYQLWFILLALFMVIVGLTAFAEPPLANKHPALPVSLILIPLVLLLGFWYLAPACRVAIWIPFVLMAAAAIGLVTAFRDEEMPVTLAIQLPVAAPKANLPVTTPQKEVKITETTTVVQKTVITPPSLKKGKY